jgi:hypothetical protein
MVVSAHLRSDTRGAVPHWPNIVLSASGAEVDLATRAGTPDCSSDACVYRWRSHITPRAPAAELDVRIGADPKNARRWTFSVPIAGGGWWLAPGAEQTRRAVVRASGPREHVWLSIYGRAGRLWGARVAARIDKSGFSEATAELPPLPAGPLQLVAASDVSETPATRWSLRPTGERLGEAPLGLVFDTLPPRVSAEQRRGRRARWPVFGLVLAAGLFELLYVAYRARGSRNKLKAHFAAARAEGPVAALLVKTPLYWLVVASGSLVAAFAVLAALSLVVGR